MNYMGNLGNWREYVPSRERLYSVLALVAVLAIGLGDFLFVKSYVVPQLRTRTELVSRLASARRDLTEAEELQDETPERLREQVATAQARLGEAADVFLSESQAAQVLNRLYDYAERSGVEITSLQAQPSPGEKKGAYDTKAFRLHAMGAFPGLANFVSRIEWAALENFMIGNVNITEGEILHILAMDITLYTSPYASVQHVPEVVPAAPRPVTPLGLDRLDEALEEAWASENWEEAIDVINRIRAIDPDHDDLVERLYTAYVNYGQELWEEGDADGASAQFDAALQIRADGQEAMEGLQQAAATPSPPLTVEEQLARRLDEPWAAEDWKEVIDLIEQIRAINPDYDDMTEKLYAAHVNYGHKLAAEGRLEEAKEEFSRALAIKPDGGEAAAGLQQLASDALPPPAPPGPQPQETTYVVRRGDTLYSIARRHGTTVEAVMAANGLTSYTIYVGQHLTIPPQWE